MTDDVYRLHENLIALGYMQTQGEEAGQGNFKKRKSKGKSAGNKPQRLTTVRLIDAILSGKEKGLEMLGDILKDVDSNLKEMLVYFMVASMIRDGILQS